MDSCDCSPYGVDTVSNPNDLVSLAWLQKGDIIQIAPLDGEEEQQNGLESSTGSLSSLKSDDYPGFRTTLAEFTPFSIRSTAPPRTSIPSTTTAFSHPSTTDYGSVQCRIESSHLPHTSHLVQNNQGLTKPNYSYTHLIFMAIESTPQKCMTVNQIYNWCESNFPFYKHAGAGWKNSLRHNLSINKSFKRLPRDSRGPGRGAFWTVEPRERATLLDAIKRNPWNYNNMAALVSASSDSTGRASVPLMDFSNPQLFGMRRFGLSQSAPGHLLRTEGMGHAGLHFDPMGNLTDLPPGSGLRLLPTLDGHLVATFGNELQNSLLNSAMDVGDYDGSSSLSHDDFDVAIPGTPRAEGVSVPLDWSAEDEEKYQSTLRLLTETATPENDELSKSGAVEYKPCGAKHDNFDVTISTDDAKLVTKQRRKSRLQPTRVGTCNECKENAAVGCEACSERRLRFLLDPLAKASFQERALEDVANALDSDQEQGPAGGPSVRKTCRKTASTINANSPKSDDSTVATTVSAVETEEVYVTPAPHIDHEYSHCQAQLRAPDDNRMVNRYNENYCAEMMRRLTRSRSYVRRSSNMGLRTKTVSKLTGEHGRPRYGCRESDASFHDPDDFSDGERDDFPNNRSPGGNDVHKQREHTRRRGRYKRRRGTPRVPSIYSENRLALPRRGNRRFLRTASRRRRGRRPLLSAIDSLATRYAARRSRRGVKIPRRPYDDSEDSLSVEGCNPDNYPAESGGNKQPTSYKPYKGSESRNRLDTTRYFESHDLCKPNHRGRRRGQKRGWNRRYNDRRVVRSDSDYEEYNGSDNSDGEDEEARYLRLACKRQRVVSPARPDESGSHSPIIYRPTYFYPKQGRTTLSPDHFRHTLNGRDINSHNVGPLWGQSRMRLVGNFSPMAWSIGLQGDPDSDELLSESDALDQEVDECDGIATEDTKTPSKREILVTREKHSHFCRTQQYEFALRSRNTSSWCSSDCSPMVQIEFQPISPQDGYNTEAQPPQQGASLRSVNFWGIEKRGHPFFGHQVRNALDVHLGYITDTRNFEPVPRAPKAVHLN
ncbi:forkhead box protein N3 [Clonorchis sinensis]|uniref:Forkhead box protein N3 n=1 Tax=Clonorchis sinensis TaxID=79923 RepID=H2KTE6_CLOSI|nr:forkhead box protein N3 [Clonorchis sinensis]